MSTPVSLIATATLRREDVDAFTAWQGRHESIAATFPGFLSSDLMPPGLSGSNEWTVILNFESAALLANWQQSPERAALIEEASCFFVGGDVGTAVVGESAHEAPVTGVTGMFFSRIKPGMEDRYRAWAVRIQAAQARFPGYRGMYLQPPGKSGPEATWTTLVRYDTAAHLDAWMTSPERAALVDEAQALVDNVEVARLATAFPGWVPVDPATGNGPPNWKTALLVLLGLFPIVVLEMRFLNPLFDAWRLNTALATFISCAVGVAATSFVTMPLLVHRFAWWLFPKADDAARTALKGLIILSALLAAEIAAFWWPVR